MTRPSDNDAEDFHRKEGPGMGHNDGPEFNEAAHEAALADRLSLLSMDEKDILLMARKALMVNLLIMVQDGSAMPADMANLRALLKDNGMILGDPTKGPSDDGTAEEEDRPLDLPTFADPEYPT